MRSDIKSGSWGRGCKSKWGQSGGSIHHGFKLWVGGLETAVGVRTVALSIPYYEPWVGVLVT
eukprot:1157442-Pelagomonas_calceolata.AAC.11